MVLITSRLLSRYLRLETSDLDEAAAATSRSMVRHEPELLGDRDFHCRFSHLSLGAISLAHWAAKGRLNIRAGPTRSSYLVRLRFMGACEYRILGESVLSSANHSVIQSPEDIAEIRSGEYNETLGISIGESAIAKELEKRLGHPLGAKVEFAANMNMRSAAAQAFRDESLRLCHEVDKATSDRPEELLVVQQAQQNLISLLIDGQRSNYTRLLNRGTGAAPWQVRAAEEFIFEFADQPLSLGDLAAIAGVSARTLQFSFRKFRGCTPMQFLRATRLERVRAELLTSGSRGSVTAIAARWGFLHFGRFASEYQKRYGEMPSATARRSLWQHPSDLKR